VKAMKALNRKIPPKILKSRRKRKQENRKKKIFEDKVVAQTTKKFVIPCLSRVLKLQLSNSGFKKG
jgi:hypothetical protein